MIDRGIIDIMDIVDSFTAATFRYHSPNYRSLLPELQDEHDSNLAIRGTQLEFLKYLIGLVSNGHENVHMSEKILILAQDQQNLRYLSRVLTSGEFTVRAFREKILFISLGSPTFDVAPSLDLMNVVLDSGADINAKDIGGESLINTALVHATATRLYPRSRDGFLLDYLKIILALIDRGARLRTSLDLSDSPLEMLIDCAARTTLYKVADWIPKIQSSCLDITIKTYVMTVHEGGIDVFEHLRRLAPAVLATLKESPWLLFEAAAFGHDSINMIKYLSHVGLDIMAVDEAGRGNPLVFAPLSSTSGVFQYLVDIGLSIHRHANGEMEAWVTSPSQFPCSTRHSCDGNAPIHAAILAGDHQAVEYLLRNGVDPNQPGCMLPIQLAATLSDSVGLDIIKSLMAAGANVNSTARNQQPEVIELDNCFSDEDLDPHSTALLISVRYSNLGIFKVLHEGGAKLPQPPNCSCEQYHVVSEINTWNGVFSDNILSGENKTQDGWCGETLSYYHIPTEKRCPCNQEVLWNPLLVASRSESRSERLFLHLLEVASPELIKSWTTQKVFSFFVTNFCWKRVTQSLHAGIFDLSCFDKEELLIRAIQTQDEHWTHCLTNDRSLHGNSMMRAFLAAVNTRNCTLIQIFLDKGCWPDDQVDLDYHSRLLLDEGCWPDDELDQGFLGCEPQSYEETNTPLNYALGHKCDQIRDVFLKHYVDASKRGQNLRDHFAKAHTTALRHGDIEFARWVNPHRNINDIYWQEFDYRRFFKTLLLRSIPFPIKLITSVQLATAFEQYRTAQWLLDAGADPNISYDAQDEGSAYHSPLQNVVKERGPLELVTTLIEKGADVNQVPMGFRGATALQFAAMTGNIEMLKVLFEAGAYINAPPCKWEGRTAIEGAAEQGRLDTVSLLLEAGADIEGRTNLNYRRTIFRAWAHGHRVLAEMVQEWKKKRYGIESYEPTESIVESMDMKTLGYAERDRLPVSDPSHPYFDPCQACLDGLSVVVNRSGGPLVVPD